MVQFNTGHDKYQLFPGLLFVIFSYGVTKTDLFSNRLNPQIKQEMLYLSDNYCFDKLPNDCIMGDRSQQPTKIILFGDSHAGSMSPFWNIVGQRFGFSIKEISASSCTPLIVSKDNLPLTNTNKPNMEYCTKQIKYVSDNLANFDVFIIAGAWDKYLPGGERTPSNFSFTDEFKSMLYTLSAHHKKIIIMGDVPNTKQNHEMNAFLRRNILPWAAHNPIQVTFKEPSPANQIIQEISSHYPNVYFFNTSEILLKTFNQFPFSNGFLIYKDDDHLNLDGSAIFANAFLNSAKFSDVKNQLKEILINKK